MTDQSLATPMLEASGDNRLRNVLMGAGALLALVGLYLVVISPLLAPDPSAVEAQPGGPPAATEDPVLDDATGQAEAAPPAATTEVFAARDPFQQLVTLSVAGAAVTATTGTTGGTSDTSTGATTATVTAAGTTTAATSGLPATRVDSTVVRMIAITSGSGAQEATVAVDGVEHTAGVGEQFATSFQVLDISGDCATLLFNDRRFTLCAGEEIRK